MGIVGGQCFYSRDAHKEELFFFFYSRDIDYLDISLCALIMTKLCYKIISHFDRDDTILYISYMILLAINEVHYRLVNPLCNSEIVLFLDLCDVVSFQ